MNPVRKLPLVLYDLPSDVYHKGEWFRDFISSTSLKNYGVSPKYAKYTQENPQEIGLEASMRGSVYHSILASITNTGSLDQFYDEFFVFDPPINPKTGESYGIMTKTYQEVYQDACAANPHKESTSQAEVDLANRMIEELLYKSGSTSESVNQLIKWGKAEVSCFCEYEGEKFKFRPDLKTSRKICDWKTIDSKDLHENTIVNQICKFKYGISAAFYQFFDYQMTGQWSEFYWVFQQKSPPYDAVIVSADRWAYKEIEPGNIYKGTFAHQFEDLLVKHIECRQTEFYPGAEIFIPPNHRGRRIMTPDVPAFESRKYQTFFN